MNYSYGGGEYDREAVKKYAVVIYLPDHLERFVAPLRERFDPDYDIVAAHITLVFPWETPVPLADLTAILLDEARDMAPLNLKLNSVGDFYPETPIIYWQVAPNEELNRLYRRLYARLELPLPFKELLPHVTVAKEISPHRVMLVKDQIASYLPRESFEAVALDLVSPVAETNWVSVRTFPLVGEPPEQPIGRS
jgi:2'-5' RNA ligase